MLCLTATNYGHNVWVSPYLHPPPPILSSVLLYQSKMKKLKSSNSLDILLMHALIKYFWKAIPVKCCLWNPPNLKLSQATWFRSRHSEHSLPVNPPGWLGHLQCLGHHHLPPPGPLLQWNKFLNVYMVRINRLTVISELQGTDECKATPNPPPSDFFFQPK